MRPLCGLLLLLVACGGGPRPQSSVGNPDAPSPMPWVQPQVPKLPENLPPPRDPTLAGGDLISITVYGQADLNLQVRIPNDGSFSYPLVGKLAAAGRTPAELESELRTRLAKDYLKDPHVTITVTEYAQRKVYILGGIKSPGGYPLVPSERITLLQLVSSAGGYTENAYKEYVQIVRRKSRDEREVIRLSLTDVERAVAKGNAGADLELWPDDLVIIPSAARVVYVLGAVKSPGWISIPADIRFTVSMAISRSGSWTKFASISRIQVLRQQPDGSTTKMVVDLDAVVEGRLELDAELKPGDVVWVPERGLF